MKKLALIVALLAVVPMANAALEFKVDGTTVANGYNGTGSTLEILMEYTGVDYYMAIVSDKAITLTADKSVMPDQSGVAADSVIGALGNVAAGFDGPVWTITSSTGAVMPLKTFFTVTAGQLPVTIQVLNVDGNFDASVAGQVTLASVPEPVTMALLGLGGLFLRKKK
ncbi:MAG: hypothetical protein A2Y07_10050 [Planctomycetes bacterium GWF2_50_10]|nr:MAG: hypothetical protein A2Y07_10050 [Planctomycetes bacterium GWF2_50_10]